MKFKFNQLQILSITFLAIALISQFSCQKLITHDGELTTINNNLSTKSLEELKPIAQRLENYWYAKRGGHIIGGLHDYVNQISKEDLIKFCMKIITENEELINLEKLNSVIEESKPESQPEPNTESNRVFISLGGLHDYIFRKDRETLLKWALTAEAYERSKSLKPFKSLEKSKIFKMPNEELMKFTLEKARKYKEIDNGDELDRLAENFGINKLMENRKKIEKLKEDLRKLDRAKLIKFAFACEFHERKGKELYGGLHDFIRLLNDDQIRTYIIEKAKKYEDLNSLEKLEMISSIERELKFLYNDPANPNLTEA